MSTRSFIGKKEKDGSVRAIYCHFDGDYVGSILKEHYLDQEKIHSLLDLGDLSSIGKEIGQEHDFDDLSSRKDWCMAYGRDRGEENIEAQMFDSEESFLERCHEDFTYLFKDGKWYYRKWHSELNIL